MAANQSLAPVVADTGRVDELRSLYLESCAVAVDLVARPEVEARWSSASVLPELSVGALAAHLGRALVTVDGYLRAEAAPAVDAATVSATDYFVAVLGEHDPIESDFHRGVRDRSATAAERGRDHVVESLRRVLDRLDDVPHDLEHRIEVLAGVQMTLGEYLPTRLVELAVHSVDLADSAHLGPPPLPEGCWRVASRVVVEVAMRRNPPRDVALALSRSDRFPPAVAF